MTDAIQYALFGIGTGALLSLLGAGLVLIYRGSGTVNFAHSAFAIVGSYTSYELHSRHGLPIGVAVAGSVLVTAAIAILFQLSVMIRLRHAAPLVRVVATLGLLTIIQQIATIRYGNSSLQVSEPLPEDPVALFGARIGRQSIYLLAIALVIVAALWAFSRYSITGLAISAAAQNERGASALGWSPLLLANLTWGAGGALAGLAGALAPAVTQNAISVNSLALTIIAALAIALFAGFRSYPLVLVGGIAIGVAQSLCVRYVHVTGVSDAVPFLAIVVLLLVRGSALPQRGAIIDSLPSVGSGRIRVLPTLAALAVVAFLITNLDPDGNTALTRSLVVAILGLSVVVVTGYAGQLSLAQYALGGLGAWIAGRLVGIEGWSFGAGAAAAFVGAVAAGALVGLPALRTRGVNLAVVTLGLGFAIQTLLFQNSRLSASPASTGIDVPSPELFGFTIDPFLNDRAYSVMSLVVLVVVVVAVCNLRRSRSGRRLLAVRTNERAAASLGIAAFSAKLYAFSLSAGIAALGGILLAFSSSTIEYFSVFEPFQSVFLVALVVIGGLGYVTGPLWASILAAGGFGIYVFDQFTTSFDEYLLLAGGVVMIVVLLVSKDGIAGTLAAIPHPRISLWRPRRKSNLIADTTAADRVRVPAQSLVVEGLTQQFGGVVALSDVSLTLAPGEVLGLLGPNGAGKTTLIDAITGYVRPRAGTIVLGDTHLHDLAPHRRARRGLTRSFQSLELFDDISVRENLLAACDRRDALAYVTNLFWPGRSRLPAPALAALHELGLEDVGDNLPRDMSYGQRRLVALARAVATQPSVLLLDEPGAGLDEHQTAELGVLVRRLAEEWGIAVLLVEHDVAMVMESADRIMVLDHGVKIAEGTPQAIRRDPAVIAAYLGHSDESDSGQSPEALVDH